MRRVLTGDLARSTKPRPRQRRGTVAEAVGAFRVADEEPFGARLRQAGIKPRRMQQAGADQRFIAEGR